MHKYRLKREAFKRPEWQLQAEVGGRLPHAGFGLSTDALCVATV